MRANKIVFDEALQRLGMPGVLGIGLLVLALVALFAAAIPARNELERSRVVARQVAQQKARGAAGGVPRPLTPADQIKAFYAAFPSETAAADTLQMLYDAASQNALTLPHAEYHMAADEKIDLARYRITLPVRGSYAHIRGFLAAALAAVPTLALEHVDFQRQKIGDAQLDARITMTLFLSRK